MQAQGQSIMCISQRLPNPCVSSPPTSPKLVTDPYPSVDSQIMEMATADLPRPRGLGVISFPPKASKGHEGSSKLEWDKRGMRLTQPNCLSTPPL